MESHKRSLKYLKSAFMAMEPGSTIVSLARQCGGGCITTEVQNFLLEHCIKHMESQSIALNSTYIKNVLKVIITSAESTCSEMIDELYEKYANFMVLDKEDDLENLKSKVYKLITFFIPDDCHDLCPTSTEFVVTLKCSLNILEGDTGCALWPSSLFLSELVLSYPMLFSGKYCFEVGSGVGLLGISLAYVGASKIVLTDGDTSTLANLNHNLKLNQLVVGGKVETKYFPWESASESTLQNYQPDIVLGTDIIYDPTCVLHLVRVLSIFLNTQRYVTLEANALNIDASEDGRNKNSEQSLRHLPHEVAPIAYIATVIRNQETFDYFSSLATEVKLFIEDVSEKLKPQNLLPYLQSYSRTTVKLYRISHSTV